MNQARDWTMEDRDYAAGTTDREREARDALTRAENNDALNCPVVAIDAPVKDHLLTRDICPLCENRIDGHKITCPNAPAPKETT